MTTMADLDPSLDGYVFFEEYVSTPSNYVLNGYMFALFGLYDWSKVEAGDHGQDRAADYFERGIETLTHVLPYYDIGGISSYDLGYITFKAKPKAKHGYHQLHTRQLHVLYNLTGEPKLREYELKWVAYFAG